MPGFSDAVPASIEQLTTFDYRNPEQLPEGGVLVVGASATGVQLAAEIRRSGRPVTLSVGEHVRLPRTYRGRDVLWWMDASGLWDERYDEVDDLNRARRLPSPQLVGTPERSTLDLNALTGHGRRAGGPLGRPSGMVARCSPAACATCSRSQTSRCRRLLDNFDEWAHADGLDAEFDPPETLRTDAGAEVSIACSSTWRVARSARCVWATGYRPDYSWLDVPVVDAKGHLQHEGGVVDSPGLYALGLPVLRRRKSTFIHGIEDDAREVIDHLAAYLAGRGVHA